MFPKEADILLDDAVLRVFLEKIGADILGQLWFLRLQRADYERLILRQDVAEKVRSEVDNVWKCHQFPQICSPRRAV